MLSAEREAFRATSLGLMWQKIRQRWPMREYLFHVTIDSESTILRKVTGTNFCGVWRPSWSCKKAFLIF